MHRAVSGSNFHGASQQSGVANNPFKRKKKKKKSDLSQKDLSFCFFKK